MNVLLNPGMPTALFAYPIPNARCIVLQHRNKDNVVADTADDGKSLGAYALLQPVQELAKLQKMYEAKSTQESSKAHHLSETRQAKAITCATRIFRFSNTSRNHVPIGAKYDNVHPEPAPQVSLGYLRKAHDQVSVRVVVSTHKADVHVESPKARYEAIEELDEQGLAHVKDLQRDPNSVDRQDDEPNEIPHLLHLSVWMNEWKLVGLIKLRISFGPKAPPRPCIFQIHCRGTDFVAVLLLSP
mmetsp:Transcript_56330/g.132027  ORF Transcript_56330/g.132027 Transcript_56330/m.132027 type:complete len:243 (-) Transcript_56330:726-1454(-)